MCFNFLLLNFPRVFLLFHGEVHPSLLLCKLLFFVLCRDRQLGLFGMSPSKVLLVSTECSMFYGMESLLQVLLLLALFSRTCPCQLELLLDIFLVPQATFVEVNTLAHMDVITGRDFISQLMWEQITAYNFVICKPAFAYFTELSGVGFPIISPSEYNISILPINKVSYPTFLLVRTIWKLTHHVTGGRQLKNKQVGSGA